MTIVLDAVAEWADFTIPGSTKPVRMARLWADGAGRGMQALVRFPEGWERPEEGAYSCGEEIVVLDGGLEVSGVAYRAGDCAWVPAGALRRGSRSSGALVLAWFSGAPRWNPGAPDAPLGPSHRTPLAAAVVPDGGLVLRGGGSGDAHGRTVLYETAPAEPAGPARVLWPESRTWARLDAGAGLPALPGRVLVSYD